MADTPLPGEPCKLLCGKLRPVVGHHFLRDAMPCEDGLLPRWSWWASFQIQNTFYKQAMLIVKFKQISCDILPWAIGTLMFRAGGMIETISSISLFIPGQNMTPFARFSTSPCPGAGPMWIRFGISFLIAEGMTILSPLNVNPQDRALMRPLLV